MTRHDPRVRLLHMLDHAREAVAISARIDRRTLREDRVLQLALTYEELRRIYPTSGQAPSAASIGNHTSRPPGSLLDHWITA